MALEPITRKEKIIAGQDLTPITRMEMFLKNFGGGGGSSVPKPLTFDYMPEGYPSKTVQTTTLMEEQELAFTVAEGAVYTVLLSTPLDITEGQTYTVNWDGTEYKCICGALGVKRYIGNPTIMFESNDTGEPFLYVYNKNAPAGQFATFDTSATHTISVKTTIETVTPMAEEFLTANTKNTTVFYL